LKETRETPEDRLYRIVRDAMCIGCGLCQSVSGAGVVSIRKVENGYLRPVVTGALTHEIADRIYETCPATRLDGLPQRLIDPGTNTDIVWGNYRQIVRAHASDSQVRFQGSTGGVLTALCQFLLQSRKVDFILQVRADASEPAFGESYVAETLSAVLGGAGSRYGPSAPLINIHDLLDSGQPFAFVGKPCDISALRNLARLDPRVNELVRYWLTPVCGGFMPPQSMERFLRDEAGIDPSALNSLRYRGFGCPGPTRVETVDGEVREFRYTDFWGTDESMWSLPFRCKVCADGVGEAADIAAADTWPGGSPDPLTEDDDPGTNAMLIRTAAGQALIEEAEAAGFLTIVNEVGPRYMDSVQPHQVKKKRSVFARWKGLADEGWTVPRSTGLRLEELDADYGRKNSERQREGTRQRLREGKAAEPTPR